MTELYDIAVIGAGPAGLAAATTAAGYGMRVVLLDAGGRPGGQYFRGRTHDRRFRRLRTRLDQAMVAGTLTYRPRHQVWTVERLDSGFVVRSIAEGAFAHRARHVVVATGAYDRHVPFPGWELPGVMAAGGAQALVKGSGQAPGSRVVVAGSGPFLLPVAVALAKAGATVVGVYEASRTRRYLRHLPVLARHPARIAEATTYAAALARHKIPYRTGHAVVAAHGDDKLTGVTIGQLDPRGMPTTTEEVACDTLAIGYGFTPQIELLAELGCDLDGDHVAVDAGQRTSVPGVYAAGETAGIGGAPLALVEGELAAHAIAEEAGRPRDRRLRWRISLLRIRRSELRAFAKVLHDASFVPTHWLSDLPDDAIVCRCEEVSAGAIRAAVRELGATDPRSVKLLTRAGMGRCQGRICGQPTIALTSQLTSTTPTAEAALALHRRPLAQPVPLGLLAETPDNDEGTS
ncbi:MAG TPA: NAD(P)/FAD-dependent oxidoreductase [Actinopolymorphaceae bacterium]